ncbi:MULTISPECIES: branched-chain amino acid ABC transporter permease [Comamonas]|uniref:branched-chain amino acid ABC transporter permease n=1 Tax=Comamonas TaxID=283 RepID=UPI001B50CF10|nr:MULTISPECIES: branched-chain amino acid ABC transporter permease [Comamonas]MBP7354220.1 branched-chain amino acid ABC transporter permease [Comamonas sp.]MDH0049054.1 branched-chain amino acid ABC transporter permease [Comamonas terrigena]MDH0513425.1 branched-chain amino acid ABC transporter permease [Comamonas terrigena]MDH1092920.1 branched-chain amino acid ABC transporter permease [Comamonas terrigena]MDH1292324.1 branched-chain amino acid ABC transporter permease [Comamonas terrigena]
MFDFLISSVTVAGIYALMALGLNLQAGYSGLLNFGHIAFAGIGAYATGIAIQSGWGGFSGAAIGVCVAMALGWCIARLGRNLASDYWGIATLAIAEILRTAATNEVWLTGGAQGISAIPSLFDGLGRPWNAMAFLALVLLAVLVFALACRRVGNGRFGRALRLMREEPQLAACMGYDLRSLKSRAIMSGAALTALAGSLYAHYMSFVGPDYMLASETFWLWTMLMIGGLGNTAGVLVGVVVVQGAYALVPFAKDYFGFSSDISGALRLGLIGFILLASLMWRSQGLVPEKVRKIA